MAKERKITYNDNDRAVVAALKGADHPMTLREINEVTGLELVAGNITSMLSKGLIEKVGEIAVERPSKRAVNTYIYINNNAKHNAKGEEIPFTDGQTAILNALKGLDTPVTLARLAEIMGVERVASGSINALVANGNVDKGEQVKVDTISKGKSGVYGYLKDVPAAE